MLPSADKRRADWRTQHDAAPANSAIRLKGIVAHWVKGGGVAQKSATVALNGPSMTDGSE